MFRTRKQVPSVTTTTTTMQAKTMGAVAATSNYKATTQ